MDAGEVLKDMNREGEGAEAIAPVLRIPRGLRMRQDMKEKKEEANDVPLTGLIDTVHVQAATHTCNNGLHIHVLAFI